MYRKLGSPNTIGKYFEKCVSQFSYFAWCILFVNIYVCDISKPKTKKVSWMDEKECFEDHLCYIKLKFGRWIVEFSMFGKVRCSQNSSQRVRMVFAITLAMQKRKSRNWHTFQKSHSKTQVIRTRSAQTAHQIMQQHSLHAFSNGCCKHWQSCRTAALQALAAPASWRLLTAINIYQSKKTLTVALILTINQLLLTSTLTLINKPKE